MREAGCAGVPGQRSQFDLALNALHYFPQRRGCMSAIFSPSDLVGIVSIRRDRANAGELADSFWGGGALKCLSQGREDAESGG